jgi:hypothetical protein
MVEPNLRIKPDAEDTFQIGQEIIQQAGLR